MSGDTGRKVRVGVIGLGKMGLSHLAMIRPNPAVEVVGVADSTGYILDVLGKYTGLATFSSAAAMYQATELDAVVIATPTPFHAALVHEALDRGIDVFCEKPLSLNAESSLLLTDEADAAGAVTQVGYHNRFVGSFREAKRLLEAGAIGQVTHIQAEAYGPVVTKPKVSTWRTSRTEGGGALYDYAAHPVDLMTWFAGPCDTASGSAFGQVFSSDTEDQVYSTLRFADGVTGQLSVDWSDDSHRKMTTILTVSGTQGRIRAERQEIQVFLRDQAPPVEGYSPGWTVRYTTEMTDPVGFYLRGEEYSAQLDYFVESVRLRRRDGLNSFRSALATDRALALIASDAAGEGPAPVPATAPVRRRWGRR